jgi:hypothetical protein
VIEDVRDRTIAHAHLRVEARARTPLPLPRPAIWTRATTLSPPSTALRPPTNARPGSSALMFTVANGVPLIL